MSEPLARHIAHEFDRLTRRGEVTLDHPDENAWALLADDLLPATTRAEMIRHASQCGRCRRRLATLAADAGDETNTDYSRELSRRETGRIIRLRAWPTALAAAAVVVFAIGLGLYSSALSRTPPLLSADASLTTFGISLQKHVQPIESGPVLVASDYRHVMDGLTAALAKPEPETQTLALATRASLSAHDYQQALSYAGRWRDAAPTDPSAQNAYGVSSFLLNKMGDARLAFEKAAKLEPQRPEYHLNAALTADRCGQADDARQHLLKLKDEPGKDVSRADIEAWLLRLDR